MWSKVIGKINSTGTVRKGSSGFLEERDVRINECHRFATVNMAGSLPPHHHQRFFKVVGGVDADGFDVGYGCLDAEAILYPPQLL